jgi:uncharacterized protein YabE (DUF348 family)
VLDFLSGRVCRVAAQAAVLTAVVAGTVAYAHTAKTVTLLLDGSSTSVQAGADDVRGLLADQGIAVSSRDLVAPALNSPLQDGEQVVVRFAKPLTVTLDGAPRTYWTTEHTLDSAFSALGIRAAGARVSVSRSETLGRAGLDVVVSNPKNVTVVADGRTRDVTTTAVTVRDLLSEEGLSARTQDRLSVLPTAPVVAGQVVALTRIDRTQVTVTEPVTPPLLQHPTDQLGAGERHVVTAGRPGRRFVTYQVVLADGKQTGRTVVSTVTSTEPVPRIVQIGTKRRPADDGGDVAGADGLNWASLARCESGGDPKAVSPAGYYGLYQFSPGTWQRVGGSGLPSDAPASEQLYRAKRLFKHGGAGQWGCGRHLYD